MGFQALLMSWPSGFNNVHSMIKWKCEIVHCEMIRKAIWEHLKLIIFIMTEQNNIEHCGMSSLKHNILPTRHRQHK